jgi:hypothetical protein
MLREIRSLRFTMRWTPFHSVSSLGCARSVVDYRRSGRRWPGEKQASMLCLGVVGALALRLWAFIAEVRHINRDQGSTLPY